LAPLSAHAISSRPAGVLAIVMDGLDEKTDSLMQCAAASTDMTQELASFLRCIARISQAWPGFLGRRGGRLKERERHGVAAEKVTENILDDLFTNVLDWPLGDVNHQVGYADLLLISNISSLRRSDQGRLRGTNVP
jgi:hypothetical protein